MAAKARKATIRVKLYRLGSYGLVIFIGPRGDVVVSLCTPSRIVPVPRWLYGWLRLRPAHGRTQDAG